MGCADRILQGISDGKVYDLHFSGKDASYGNKVSIVGQSVDDVYYLYYALHEWLMSKGVAHKIATVKRLNANKQYQRNKAFTIYIPNEYDLGDFLHLVYKRIGRGSYKGHNGLRLPFPSYTQFMDSAIMYRNDRDDCGNYLPA